MKTRPIRHTATLVYYDGIQVFEGRDSIGGRYIGVMIDSADDTDRYLVTGVAPERLRQFRSGDLDLRTLLLDSGREGWCFADASDDLRRPLELVEQEGPLEGREFLPDAGFTLNSDLADDTTVREARERNNVVLELDVEPPEAAEAHRILVTTLSGLLAHVQAMVKHACRKAAGISNLHSAAEHSMYVVVPASPGSFRMTLEAAGAPDLFGYRRVAQGLKRMDALFESTKDPETARQGMAEHSGHLAGSYIRLMRFLSQHDMGIRYVWAEPMGGEPGRGGVSKALARELVDELSGATSLAVEHMTLVGDFAKVDRGAGNWGLDTAEGRKSGKIRDGGPSLDGLVVGKRYRFHCSEEFEIVDASGRERHTLYLDRLEPA